MCDSRTPATLTLAQSLSLAEILFTDRHERRSVLDWQLVGRAGVRYTVVYAGATVGVVSLTGAALFLLGLAVLGLVLLLFVAGGGGSVRMGTTMANAQSMGISGTTTDPSENAEFHTTIDADLKLLFYAVGLIVFGFVGMIVLGKLQ